MRQGAMPLGSTARALTLEQWGALDEDVAGELIDGVLEEEEMPSVLHELVVVWFIAVLRAWSLARGGLVLGSEAKLAVGRTRGRKPDLSVFRKGVLPGLRDTVIRVPPAIVVEVVSSRPRDVRRDRVEKLRDYAACKAKHYWLVDPELRTLDIFELDASRRYVHVLGATGGTLARVPGCPGLRLHLGTLWAEVESRARAGNGRAAPSGPRRARPDRARR